MIPCDKDDSGTTQSDRTVSTRDGSNSLLALTSSLAAINLTMAFVVGFGCLTDETGNNDNITMPLI